MKILKFTSASESSGTLRKLSGTNLWAVVEPFVWWVDYDDHSKGKIIIESGFITDMGSIPRIFWIFLDPTKWLAFVLHDYLYTYQVIEEKPITRKVADCILKEALIAEGCKNPELFCIYKGVRIGGGSNFKKST